MKNRNLVSLMIVLFSSQPCLVTFDIGSMIDGMGTSFGAPPTGYIYSWEVWNDASVPIHVEQEGIASFMGAYFPSAKGFYNKKTLPSIFDAGGAVSKGEYHNQDYYFKFYIGPNSDVHTDYAYKESLTQLPLKKNDTKIYYYHVYTSPSSFDKGNAVHKPAVECMGWNDPTTTNFPDPKIQPSVKLSNQVSSIAFYNSSGTDVQVSLSYGPNPYKFTVEKYSYNSLAVPTPQEKKSSDSSSGTTPTPAAKSNVSIQGIGDSTTQAAAEIVATTTDSLDSLSALTEVALPPLFSLRPNTITFSAYDAASGTYKAPFRTVQLPSQGFDGCAYTFEIFQDPGQTLEVGVQGFSPGNYNVGITPRIRDVTPCPCTFWYQSFVQDGSVDGYADLPGQVWVVYGGNDNPIQTQVVPGQVVSWNLTRPLLSQGDQFVYFVYVVTADNTVGQNFVQKIAKNMLGNNIVNEFSQAAQTPFVAPAATVVDTGLDVSNDSSAPVTPPITVDQQVATLMGFLTIADGVIEDKDQGVIGYILGADIFTSSGLGFGRFYYVLAPSVISFDSIATSVLGYLDSSKTAALGAAAADIQKSVTATVNDWFRAYMKKPGDVQVQVQKYLLQYGNAKIVDATSGQLTKFGQSRLQAIMSGKVSLKYPSMKLSTITNQYVYDFGKTAPDKMPDGITILDQSYGAARLSARTTDSGVVPKA